MPATDPKYAFFVRSLALMAVLGLLNWACLLNVAGKARTTRGASPDSNTSGDGDADSDGDSDGDGDGDGDGDSDGDGDGDGDADGDGDSDGDVDADGDTEPGCTSNAHCTDPTPLCDLTTGACVECLEVSDCPAGPHAHATCADGLCDLICDASWGDCDANPANGCETDVTQDDDNCGRCGNRCGEGLECETSVCTEG